MSSGMVGRLSDAALMNAVCDNGIRLRHNGHDHIARVTDRDIPGWEVWIQLKWSPQVVHFFLQGHDAFDLAMVALRTRVSPPALGVLRFMAEATLQFAG